MKKRLPLALLASLLVACGIPDLKPFSDATAEMATVRETRATGDRILDKAGDAIDAWQKAHQSLQAAARGTAEPSVRRGTAVNHKGNRIVLEVGHSHDSEN